MMMLGPLSCLMRPVLTDLMLVMLFLVLAGVHRSTRLEQRVLAREAETRGGRLPPWRRRGQSGSRRAGQCCPGWDTLGGAASGTGAAHPGG